MGRIFFYLVIVFFFRKKGSGNVFLIFYWKIRKVENFKYLEKYYEVK